jgi:acyl-CoA reductase-like NAD-dependent aldehyde dehydrogenase
MMARDSSRRFKLWAKLTPAERKQFLEEISNQ